MNLPHPNTFTFIAEGVKHHFWHFIIDFSAVTTYDALALLCSLSRNVLRWRYDEISRFFSLATPTAANPKWLYKHSKFLDFAC
jgi:hypothetical protein